MKVEDEVELRAFWFQDSNSTNHIVPMHFFKSLDRWRPNSILFLFYFTYFLFHLISHLILIQFDPNFLHQIFKNILHRIHFSHILLNHFCIYSYFYFIFLLISFCNLFFNHFQTCWHSTFDTFLFVILLTSHNFFIHLIYILIFILHFLFIFHF